MNNQKEMLERRAALLGEINGIRKPGVANLDSDKRELLSRKLDEIARLDSDLAAEKQIETLNDTPRFRLPGEGKTRSYSIGNVIRSLMGENVDIGYEREVSQEIARRSGLSAAGILIPIDMRANEGTTATAPGVIATAVGDYGMALYPRTVLDKLGVRVLTGLSGTITWPVQGTQLTGTAKGEIADADEKQLSIPQKTANPHRLPVVVKMSKQLLMQSTPALETFIAQEIQSGYTGVLERYAFQGTGADDQMTGLANVAGISKITNTGGIFDKKLVTAAKKVLYKTAPVGAPAYGWAVDPDAYEVAANTEIAAGTGRYVYDETNVDAVGTGRVGGFTAPISSNVGEGKVYLTDWTQVILQHWGALDLTVDKTTFAEKAIVRLILNGFSDITCRYPSLIVTNGVRIAMGAGA
ncbi:MAG: phage major capsid protein [Lentisphaeria bacterium]|nr:phage major capsid protein [Lentisphaeria bacterium]